MGRYGQNLYKVSFHVNEAIQDPDAAEERLYELECRPKIRGFLSREEGFTNFGTIADQTFHELGAPENVQIRNAEYNIVYGYDLAAAMESGEPGPVPLSGFEGHLLVETDRALTREEQSLLKKTADTMNERLCPDLFASDSFGVGEPDYGSAKSFWGEEWTPEKVEQFHVRRQQEQEQREANWKALWPEEPYGGPTYPVELGFEFAVPVTDTGKALEVLESIDIAGVLQGNPEDFNSGRWGWEDRWKVPRMIADTGWELDGTKGTLKLDLTAPYGECDKYALNMVRYEFGKEGAVSEAIRESGVLEGNVPKSKRLFYVDNKVQPAANRDLQDFVDAVEALTADSKSMQP